MLDELNLHHGWMPEDIASARRMEADMDAGVDCPSCSHVNGSRESLMGTLGRTNHHRCRACGWQWAVEEGED